MIFSDDELVVVGGGHAATIAVRAAGKGLIKPSAVAAGLVTSERVMPCVAPPFCGHRGNSGRRES